MENRAEPGHEGSALLDALTELPNRILFEDRLQVALSHARRYHRMCALMRVVLDRCAEISARLGVAACDQLRVEAGRRLLGCVRETDTVARVGTDAFALILTELREEGEVQQVAERCVHLLGEPYYLDAGVPRASCSIGIALYPQHGVEAEQLQRHAESALRIVTQHGGNAWRLYAAAACGDRPQGDLL